MLKGKGKEKEKKGRTTTNEKINIYTMNTDNIRYNIFFKKYIKIFMNLTTELILAV